MKKRQIARQVEIKHRQIKRKAGNFYASSEHSNKHAGNHWDWDDEQFISDLGF